MMKVKCKKKSKSRTPNKSLGPLLPPRKQAMRSESVNLNSDKCFIRTTQMYRITQTSWTKRS